MNLCPFYLWIKYWCSIFWTQSLLFIAPAWSPTWWEHVVSSGPWETPSNMNVAYIMLIKWYPAFHKQHRKNVFAKFNGQAIKLILRTCAIIYMFVILLSSGPYNSYCVILRKSPPLSSGFNYLAEIIWTLTYGNAETPQNVCVIWIIMKLKSCRDSCCG